MLEDLTKNVLLTILLIFFLGMIGSVAYLFGLIVESL
jgi:hypothetical protein|nr:MAG: hypothetical protein [Caudoviricetes sp.]